FLRQARLPEARIISQIFNDVLRSACQVRIIITDDCKLQAAPGSANAKAIGLECKGADGRKVFHALADICENLLLAARALLPRSQGHDHEAGILSATAGDRKGRGNLA